MAAHGPRLVVRNTFLEVFDDSPPAGEPEGAQRRPRAQTDITDAKLPRKVTYPMEDADPGQQFLGQASPSGAGYSPLHINSFSEESPHVAAMRGKGGPPLMHTPGPLGWTGPAAAMGMPPFPLAGPFPPPWGYPVGPGAPPPFPGYPGMPWPYPTAPFPTAAAPMPQPQAGRGAGKRGQGEKGCGKRGGNASRAVAASENLTSAGRGGKSSAASSPARRQRGSTDSAASSQGPQVVLERTVTGSETTVMLRNIPNRYTQTMLLSLLDEHDFKLHYDFVYLPMDFRNGVNLGYAFVNLLTHEDALRFMETFEGFSRWFFDSAKVCEVSWAHPHQGLNEHVERYRNSPVMHPTMPEEYKPMIFKDGARVPFPLPTKAIRAPKLRPFHDRPPPAQGEGPAPDS
mmetsp:Transcript_102858/g.286435  ORF Transcript_102858/g.286435 Transcript_102858/m.286435 type:complete len:400 (+) Transcript_102858:103-1302(+)